MSAASHTPGPWLWLQSYEHKAEAEGCGCVLKDTGPKREPGACFYLCPLHATAPELAEALKRLIAICDEDEIRDAYAGTDSFDDATEGARAALQKAGILA